MSWRDKAACRDITTNPDFDREHDPFYNPPEPEDDGDKWEFARNFCSACPVHMDCLNDALLDDRNGTEETRGFRGGLSFAQRKRVSLGLPAVPAKKAKPKPAKGGNTPEAQAGSITAARRRREEFVLNIEDLLDLELSGRDILARIGTRADAVRARLVRADRLDVWDRIGLSHNGNPLNETGA